MGDFQAHITQFLKRFIQDDQGQSITEYVLILSVTIVGGAALARAIMGSLDKGILNLGAQLEKDLKTGKASLNVWQN
jgi:Flp pilus assembly pilin Flp